MVLTDSKLESGLAHIMAASIIRMDGMFLVINKYMYIEQFQARL